MSLIVKDELLNNVSTKLKNYISPVYGFVDF